MANDTDHNPWVIDTASGTLITAEDVYLDAIRWVGATTAGHQCVIQDGNSNVIFESLANGANFIDERSFGAEYTGPRRVIAGIKVTTLGSGKVYLHLA